MRSKEIMNVPRMNSRSFSDRIENRLKRKEVKKGSEEERGMKMKRIF